MNNVNINVQCECYHRRGLFYYANPLAWGRPCRRCRRMMARGIVVVPQVAPVPVQTTTTTVMPAQSANNWQMQQQMQQQQQLQQQRMTMQVQMQQQEPQMMSALPPKYDQVIAAN